MAQRLVENPWTLSALRSPETGSASVEVSPGADRALEALLERVKGLSGPDRDVDLAIAQALVPDVIVQKQDQGTMEVWPFTYWEYTASLDAVVALCERVKPKWAWFVDSGGHPRPYAQVQEAEHWGDPFVEPHLSEGATPALALLAALLSALIQSRSPSLVGE